MFSFSLLSHLWVVSVVFSAWELWLCLLLTDFSWIHSLYLTNFGAPVIYAPIVPITSQWLSMDLSASLLFKFWAMYSDHWIQILALLFTNCKAWMRNNLFVLWFSLICYMRITAPASEDYCENSINMWTILSAKDMINVSYYQSNAGLTLSCIYNILQLFV